MGRHENRGREFGVHITNGRFNRYTSVCDSNNQLL